ncbi:hypothetical protein Tco_0998100 [Tanacetum coccineum]
MEGCSGVEAAAVAVAESGGEGVEARELTGRIDPEMRIILGVGRKIPPEKFSGGGEGSPEIMGRGERYLKDPTTATITTITMTNGDGIAKGEDPPRNNIPRIKFNKRGELTEELMR